MDNKRGFEWVEEKFRRFNTHSSLPTRATKNSAGYDFYANANETILPGESKLIFTDVKAYFQPDEMLMLAPRSSMGKHKVMLANTVGIIDQSFYNNADNDGNIGFFLYNYGDKPFEIKTGDRIGQGMFIKLAFSDDKPTTSRIGGFGSTGIK